MATWLIGRRKVGCLLTMSSGKGEAMDTEESAPLDLRVKKDIKAEPKTPEGAPLNLSKPPTPAKSVSPNTVSRGAPGGNDDVRVASEKISPARTVRTSHGDHDTPGMHGSNVAAVSPGGDVRNYPNAMVRPKIEDHRVVEPVGKSPMKHHIIHTPQMFGAPRHLLARGVPQEIPVVGPNLPVCGDRNHMVPRGSLPPSMHPGPLLVHTLPVQAGMQSALSPPRMIRHPIPITSQVHHHHPKLPSPRTGSKKKSPLGPRESTPVHSVVPSPDVSTVKSSPSPTKRQSKAEREEHSPHAASPMVGMHTTPSRLIAHGAPSRSAGAAIPVAVGVTQMSSVSHPIQRTSPTQELGHQRPRGLHPRSTQPIVVPQGHVTASLAPHGRGAVPQQPRSAPQPPVPSQLSPQHRAGAPPLVHGQPVEALLHLRHPVSAAQAESIMRHAPRAPHPTAVLPSPRAPLTHPQPTQSTPSHPPGAPHTTSQPIVPPNVGHSPIGHPPPPHRHPTPVEVHQDRIRHPSPVPGKGFIPKGREYYLSGPHSHLSSGGPPIVPPPGPTSAASPSKCTFSYFSTYLVTVVIKCFQE